MIDLVTVHVPTDHRASTCDVNSAVVFTNNPLLGVLVLSRRRRRRRRLLCSLPSRRRRRLGRAGQAQRPDGGALPGALLLRALLPQHPLWRGSPLLAEPEPPAAPMVAIGHFSVSLLCSVFAPPPPLLCESGFLDFRAPCPAPPPRPAPQASLRTSSLLVTLAPVWTSFPV